MAPRSLSQFDPLDSDRLGDPSVKETDSEGKLSDFAMLGISSSDRPAGDSDASREDPRLMELVEEARRVTGASAAALALRQEDAILCRAATGASAPSLDTPLSLDSGLSGACVKSRTFQRCDDSEIDARVDAALCRRMGIRSILVFPILLQGELLGVIEVFSPKPNAFADIHALQSLSRLVASKLVCLTQAAVQSDMAPPPAAEVEVVEEPAPDIFLPSESPEYQALELEVPQEDYWTPALTFVVIVFALALGWMVGIGMQRASNAASRKANPRPATTAAPQAVLTSSASSSAVPRPAQASAKLPSTSSSASAPKIDKQGDSSSSDLVVSQDGKVIYRQPATQTGPSTDNSPLAASSGAEQPGGKSSMAISPDAANQYVIHRVEPEYPEQARQQRVQGPVTLKVTVDKNGVVKTLKTLRGDPQLAAAATSAVQQWRFKPVMQNGSPAEFQTDVTVMFRLP